jgi:hypothetical protein
MRRVFFGLLFIVSSCGISGLDKSEQDLRTSKANYEQCLESRPAEDCENPRAIYEADLQDYQAHHKGTSRYGTYAGGRYGLTGGTRIGGTNVRVGKTIGYSGLIRRRSRE